LSRANPLPGSRSGSGRRRRLPSRGDVKPPCENLGRSVPFAGGGCDYVFPAASTRSKPGPHKIRSSNGGTRWRRSRRCPALQRGYLPRFRAICGRLGRRYLLHPVRCRSLGRRQSYRCRGRRPGSLSPLPSHKRLSLPPKLRGLSCPSVALKVLAPLSRHIMLYIFVSKSPRRFAASGQGEGVVAGEGCPTTKAN
jgi:hypothetical protein